MNIADFIRASVRPIVTIIFVAVIAHSVIDGITLPQWFLGLAIPAITWWWADRTIQHVRRNGD